MQMTAEVQLKRPVRSYRDKQGINHEIIDIVLIDKGESRLAGVGLVFSSDRDKDNDGFRVCNSLKADDRVEVGITALRFLGGEYHLSGTICPLTSSTNKK